VWHHFSFFLELFFLSASSPKEIGDLFEQSSLLMPAILFQSGGKNSWKAFFGETKKKGSDL
jgi:hypothetical protein